MLSTFVLQVTTSGFVIRKIGSTRSMFFLPVAFLVAFLLLSVVSLIHNPGSILFWAVVTGMGLRIAFFDSFFSPNFQIFFSSLPQEIRGRGKLSIEGVIKPCAMVAASMCMLFITPRLPLHVAMFLFVLVALLAIVQTFRLRLKYTESLSRYLTGFSSKRASIALDELNFKGEKDSISILEGMLDKEELEIKRFAIEVFGKMADSEASTILINKLGSDDGQIRAMIIAALGQQNNVIFKDIFSRHLLDKDYRVVANAILALAPFKDPEIVEGIEPFLLHQHIRARAFEVFDNTGDTKLNRMILDLLDNKYCVTENLKGEIDDMFIRNIYLSGNSWVRSCAYYFCDTMSLSKLSLNETFSART